MPEQPEAGSRMRVPAWLRSVGALLLGLALSLAAAWTQHVAMAGAQRNLSERQADRTMEAVKAQLEDCGLLVRSVQTLFLASNNVTDPEFQSIYANLRPRALFPSLQAIAYAPRTPGPDGADNFPTMLVAPRAGNEALIGLDIRSQPANLRGLEVSRDTDHPAMSGAFTLVQRQGAAGLSDGIVIRLPVFTPGPPPRNKEERRQRFAGSVAASFQVRSLIERALPTDDADRMQVNVTDVTGGASRALFVPAAASGPDGPPSDGMSYRFRRDVSYGGRLWRMDFVAQPDGDAVIRQPALILLAGTIASLLLAALAWSTANTRAHAQVLANRMSARFRESEARFRALNELLPTLVLLARTDGELVYANQAGRAQLALPDPEQSQTSIFEVFDDPDVRERISEVVEHGSEMRNISVRCEGPGYPAFWATLSVSAIDLDGTPHILAVANDISELRDLNELLTYQAAHDPLTGLANRREFGRRLDLAIEGINRGGPPAALLYFDLDQFKIINDTSGHHVGDQLLAQLAVMLGSHLVHGETIARLGGDEFGILLEPATRERALEFAEQMRLEIDGFVFSAEQRTYAVSVSVGLILIDRPGLTRREVLSLADTACYMAKERGRNRVHLYSEKDAETTRRRSEMEWASRLRQALIDERFILYYQELSEIRPGDRTEGVHMEMLIRLRDEDGKMVPPGAFIPAAERFGLMLQLDRWVVETTLANFSSIHASGQPIHLCAINLSALTVEDETFAQFVLERLQRYGVPPGKVCFEITETAAVASMVRVVELMEALRSAGCKFSLDDFGAGMASFGYLKNLPVDYVKIDGSFIRNIETDPVSYSIVRAVTDIGHQLGLGVVAEWVTDARALEILRGIGLDYAQGYFLHEPEPATCFRTPAGSNVLAARRGDPRSKKGQV